MATGRSDNPAPIHLWIIGMLLLLWHGFATVDYIMTVIRFEPYLAGYTEEIRSYYFNAPLWMYIMWGVSMVGGLLGSILLLFRRRSAVLVFAAAWVCSVIAALYSIANPVPGGGQIFVTVTVIFIAFLVWLYIYWLQKRGVLR